MNRPFYSEYVRHALRFYTRNLARPSFKSDVDKNNWYACANSLRGFSEKDRDIIIAVYGAYDTLSDNVYETAQKLNINQSVIWDLMKDVEHKIARRRGLI